MGNGVNWSDMWNSWGKFGFGGGGMGMPFGGGFGGMGCTFGDGFNYGNVGDSWGGSSSSSSSDSQLSYEEKKAKYIEDNKVNKELESLKQLLRGLAKAEPDEEASIKYDLSHIQGKDNKEKLEYLKDTIYPQYKDKVKNNLTKIEALSKDFSGIGYESDTELDEKLSELHSQISNDSNAEFKVPENTEILDLLSSWNSNSSTGGKHLMETLIEKYTALPETQETEQGSVAQARRGALEAMADSLKSQLSTKAGELANNAMLKDDTLKDQLKALKSSLDAAPLQSCADKFEDLYEACRIAGAKIMENTYKEKYEFLGGDNLFGEVLSNTIEDLKAEGYDGEVSKDIKAPIDLSNKTPKEQVAALIEEGTLQEVKIGNNTYYEEAVPTGGRSHRRVFQINNDKLQVRENVKIENGALAWVDENGDINNTATDVSATTIQSDVNNAKPTYSNDLDSVVTFLGMKKESSQIELDGKKYNVYSVKIGGETKKYARTEKGFHEIYNNQNQQETFLMNSPLSKADLIKKVYSQTSGGRDKGKQSAEDLVGYTNKDEQQRVANCINNEVNAVTVWEYLKGYQSNHGGGERFFDQLNNEDWDLSGKDSKKDLMKKVLDYCIDNLKARMEADPARKDEYQSDITSLETYKAEIDSDKVDYEAIDTFTYKYVKDHRDFCS